MDKNPQSMVQHKYGRDYLLQLRLHPFSLQKPVNVKEHDIVKEKLYLHQLTFSSNSPNTRLSYPSSDPDSHLSLKDPEKVLPYHQSVPDCFSQNCVPYIMGRKSTSIINSKPSCASKSQQMYIPDYVNAMQKLKFQNAFDYEDFVNDEVFCSNIPWLKPFSSFSEETWNCQSQQSNLESSSKSSSEGLFKSKKKPLPIIDPKNGKNILDSMCEVSTSQESFISEGNDGNSENKKDDVLILEPNKQSDHVECSLSETEYNNENVSQNVSDVDCSCLFEISGFDNQSPSCAGKKTKKLDEDNGNNISTTFKNGPDLDLYLKETKEKTVDEGMIVKEMQDSDYGFYKKFASNDYDAPKISDSFESVEGNALKDVHDDWFYQRKNITDRNKTMPIQESDWNFEDQLKMNIKIMREKVYSIKQEQQKMAILQSFLSFKKHQLDKSYRKIDDKKNEIANWECSLANKAKRLQEKELRLEAKRLSLLDKESKLDRREKMLNERENQKYIVSDAQEGDKAIEKVSVNSESKTNDSDKAFSIHYELGDPSEGNFLTK